MFRKWVFHVSSCGEVPSDWPSDRSSPLYRRSGFRPPEELLELPLDDG
ncbi:hypothetical protein [Streptomyces sp. NRRL S-448]